MSQSTHQRAALVNGRIVLPDEVVDDQIVLIEDGTIIAITHRDAIGDANPIDVGGRWITPGLIDLHTHGALGHTFNEPTSEAFTAICDVNARHGVTSLCATLAPAPLADLKQCFEYMRTWRSERRSGAHVLGGYLESPYTNLTQKGALDPRCLLSPDDGTADELLEYADVLCIFMVAPELPGAIELVDRINRAGIVPAAGHSSAHDTHVLAAMEHGLRHVTHIWSAMSMVVREGPWRKPGLLESALTFDGLTVEMIADNKHLPPTLMKLAYKCIGPDRLCAISDATSGAGLPNGSRFVMGGMEYEVTDGVGMMFDRSAFAGSTTLLGQMLPILINVVGIPLVEAVRMATLTPARIVGVAERKGSLQAGKDADIVIWNEDFTPWRVMMA
ncbi:MAG: N-acetylglucosamine-6-phosphate deacetylase [Chloroflexi bacterium]|nr:N-acetylglucosamine-6-phosphate deacetylase [Chloroflexota bacterium]